MIFLREKGNLTQKDNVYYSLYEMHLDLVEQVINCHLLYHEQARICPVYRSEAVKDHIQIM